MIVKAVEGFTVDFLIERWLTAGILEEGVFVETTTGFPQSGVQSPLLCNIALHGLGSFVNSKSADSNKPIMICYAETLYFFVLLCKYYAGGQEALRHAEDLLGSRGLKFKDTIERAIVHVTQGFDFFNCTFRRVSNYGYNKQLTVQFSRAILLSFILGTIKLLAMASSILFF